MSFNERLKISENMANTLIPFLNKQGFIIEQTGYENYVSSNTRSNLRFVHNNPTVTFLRYLPDYFCMFQNDYFFIEIKVMDSPIKLDSRVKKLQQITGINDLSKENIGVIETAALNNYKNLSKIGVKILIIIYCTFHPERVLLEWENNLIKFYDDKVKIGQGNASFTPYTNIHLDKMKNIQDFFQNEFKIKFDEQTVSSLINAFNKL